MNLIIAKNYIFFYGNWPSNRRRFNKQRTFESLFLVRTSETKDEERAMIQSDLPNGS